MADVFVLSPANEDYVAGQAAHPRIKPGVVIVTMVVLVLIVLVLPVNLMLLGLLLNLPNNMVLALITLALALLMDVGIGLVLHRMLRQRRGARHGQLVRGEVTHVSAAVDEVDKDRFSVSVTYQIVSPQTGEMLTGRGADLRQKLVQADLPKVGDPVAVQYLDDRMHYLL